MRALVILLAATALSAQIYKPGPQVLTFFSGVDDTDQPYGLYVPKNMIRSRKYPLVVSLHGAGSNHRLNLRRVFGKGNIPGETDAEASRYFPPLRDVDFFVATPFARGTMGYQGIAEQDVFDVLADVKKRFPIDEDRVYLTGLSMGGGGTLWLGLTHPDIWAAIAAVCPAPPPVAESLAPNALNLPVRLYQGALDPIVPRESVRAWHKRLLDLDTTVEYFEYPNLRHNAWDTAYANGAIFDWFAKYRRTRFPERVRYVTDDYDRAAAYWVRLDRFTPGTLASIDARFDAANRLTITTQGLDAFTLLLQGHPRFNPRQAFVISIDAVKMTLKPAASLSFTHERGGWRHGLTRPAPGEKGPGADGPIADAASSRHVYVYGTADLPPTEELARRRAEAATAAQWVKPPQHLAFSPRVMSDAEVRDSDIRQSHLWLFGTAQTNRLIARFAGQLPLALNAGAADYGLLFIAPLDGRYVVVNSGLPWWTGEELARRPGWRYLPPLWRDLLSFGDYVLFKGSLAGVVAEGRFDAQWKVPAEAARTMRDTGAVSIRP